MGHTKKKLVRVDIIGPGAVGTMIGYYLQGIGAEVGFIGRQGAQEYKTTVDDGSGPVRLSFSKLDSKPDLIIVAVKSYQVESVLKTWGTEFKQTTTVIISNGILDEVVRQFGLESSIALGTTNIGVKLVDDGLWRVFNNNGQLVWGSESRSRSMVETEIVKALSHKGFSYEKKAKVTRQEKWLFNTVINSLCAIHKLASNGDLLSREVELTGLFNDAYSLGTEIFGKWALDKDPLWQKLIQLIQSTKGNENSMARDIRLGRPTENEFLSGLVNKSEADYPVLREIYKKLSL